MKNKKWNKLKIIALILFEIVTLSSVGCINKREEICVNIPEDAMELEVDIANVYGDAKAIVTIISDDGFYDTGININKIFGEREIECTVAGCVAIVSRNKDEWGELLKDGNIEIVSHSYNHIRMAEDEKIAMNEQALEHEILDADKWLEQEYDMKQIVFVCPENQMCSNGYEILKENGFWSARQGTRGYNELSPKEGTNPGDWYNLKCFGVMDEGTTTDTRNEWVNTAIEKGVWLIEMWHNVVKEEDGAYQSIRVDEACEHLDYLVEAKNRNDIWIATYTDAVKYLREKQNVKVQAFVVDEELIVKSYFENEKMTYDVFDYPLTVKIWLPQEVVMESGKEMFITDIIPGKVKRIKLK